VTELGRFTALPLVDDDTRAYWSGGVDGRLRIHRCASCRAYVHPPAPVCRHCASREVAPTPVSGRGVLYAYSLNVQDWGRGPDDEFVYAVVELVEQDSLRVSAHLRECPVEEIAIGMPVRVGFERVGDVDFPVFVPDPADR